MVRKIKNQDQIGFDFDPKKGIPTFREYPFDEFAIRDEKRTAQDVNRRIKNKRFKLDPDFQRDLVWDDFKQSRLIESVLMRIPIPVFYVAEDENAILVVVDGRQRLETFRRFFSGDLILKLPQNPHFNKKRFADLSIKYQNIVEDCQLHFYIIDSKMPDQAKLNIFERVNGGEILTRQQMRNALYSGNATQFLKKEASKPLFSFVTGSSLDTKKMQDREFINRFCSFGLLDISDYKGDMDEWLAQGLKELNNLDEEKLNIISQKLEVGLKNNEILFKQHSFRKIKNINNFNSTRSIINSALFDVMCLGLSEINIEKIMQKSQQFKDNYQIMLNDKNFVRAITYATDGIKEVKTRFEIAKNLFEKIFEQEVFQCLLKK